MAKSKVVDLEQLSPDESDELLRQLKEAEAFIESHGGEATLPRISPSVIGCQKAQCPEPAAWIMWGAVMVGWFVDEALCDEHAHQHSKFTLDSQSESWGWTQLSDIYLSYRMETLMELNGQSFVDLKALGTQLSKSSWGDFFYYHDEIFPAGFRRGIADWALENGYLVHHQTLGYTVTIPEGTIAPTWG